MALETDAELMLRVQVWGRRLVRHLLEKYRTPVMKFIQRWFKMEAVAEELAQDVFLRVYRPGPDTNRGARFFTIGCFACYAFALNSLRDHRKERIPIASMPNGLQPTAKNRRRSISVTNAHDRAVPGRVERSAGDRNA